MPSKFKSSEEFFSKAREVHLNKYQYDDSSYRSLNKKISIVCPTHGEYQQLAHDHIRGHGCRKCSSDNLKTWTEQQEQFLRENYDKGSFWCATQLNKTDCAIRGHAKKIGITQAHKKINSNIPPIFWSSVVSRAQEDKFELDFDSDFIWELYEKQEGKCALTGRPIKFSKAKSTRETTASLDRIDSKKDYTKDNVQLTHKIVNRCKLNCPEDVFYSICKDVYLNNRGKYETHITEWELDIMNDRSFPVTTTLTVDYENMNFAEFKRLKTGII